MNKKISFLKKIDAQSLKLFKHIGLASVFRTASILINLILVPLSISYLGASQYGLWLTLFSFIGWFNIVNFGVGNGLRNKLTHALTIGNIKLAKEYISTAYVILALISILTFLLFSLVFPFVNWNIVFNLDGNDNLVKQLLFVAFVIFSINITLSNINIIFYANQKSSYPEFLGLLRQIIILIAIYTSIALNQKSLFVYGNIIMFSQIVIYFTASLVAFFGKYKRIHPNIKYFNKTYIKDIFSIGIKFFFLQISSILLASTDTFIINLYLGSSQVTVYSIPYKYFMLCTTIMTIVAAPYWSAFTQAYSKNDNIWMRKSIKMLLMLSILLTILIIIMIIASNGVYVRWVGSAVKIPFLLTLIIGINTIIRVLMYPIIMFLNGVGKVQIELYLGISMAIVNIPLSIFLAYNMKLGVSGVVLATFLLSTIELMVLPLQVRRILNKSAKGIWNA